MKLFLDDVREPRNCLGYMYRRVGADNLLYQEEWTVVRNAYDFQDFVNKNKNSITVISLDHDLGEDEAMALREKGISKRKARQVKKTVMDGNDCAEFLLHAYGDADMPKILIHSMNPVGAQRIAMTLGLDQKFAW